MITIKKASQSTNGKAFEWAVALAVHHHTNFEIIINSSAEKAKISFNEVSEKKRAIFSRNARVAVKHILEKESARLKTTGHIEISGDKLGQEGDVRDVIIKSGKDEIGLSCKTNHEALKHSRLSGSIDFVKKWNLSEQGCSQEYWTKIEPLFGALKKIKVESSGKALWVDLPDHHTNYYWPILDAFSAEIERLKGNNADTEKKLCHHLLLYLIGSHDFYKIISRDKKIEILAFNFQGTLTSEKTKLPESIVSIDKKNGGSYSKTIRFTRGYTINFRIHNASSRVEPSLKFDINAVGTPEKIYKHVIELNNK
jgi:hypothetical protein